MICILKVSKTKVKQSVAFLVIFKGPKLRNRFLNSSLNTYFLILTFS